MSVAAPPLIRSNLPLMLAPMVGREREQDDLRTLLSSPRVRLITLTGPGGIGKTRLAVEIGRSVVEMFASGVAYVPLDPIRDVRLVLPTIAQTIGMSITGREGIIEALADFLDGRALLLILDNFEQVEGAASDVGQLLSVCEQLKVLATSRIPLDIYGEREYPVSPLPLPEIGAHGVDAFGSSGAIQLFVERASEVAPGFALTSANVKTVVEICRRLDGIPLALELAATRIKVLSPETLLDRLSHRLQVLTSGPRDLPPRLRTMRDAIAWSHDLLSPDERALFRRLAVFPGTFSLEAAEQGTGDRGQGTDGQNEHTAPSTLDLITALVDESLVLRGDDEAGDTRYSMFQTIWEFAQERLAESGEEQQTREAHARYFCTLCERAAPELIGVDQNAWLDRLECDHDNLRAALSWAIEYRQVSLAQRFGAALWRFWWVRGHVLEGKRWFDQILELGDEGPTLERGTSIYGAGAMAEHLGDYDRAPELYRAALEVARIGGHRFLTAQTTEALGLVAQDQGQYDEAVKFHLEARAIYDDLGHRRGLISTTHNLGSISYYRGDIADAQERYLETLRLIREIGDSRAISMVLGNLGVIALAQCDFGRAKQYQEETLTHTRAAKDDLATGIALINLADAERNLGNLDRAEELHRDAFPLFEKIGSLRLIANAHHGMGRIAQARGDSARAVEHLTRALSLAHDSHDSASIAACLESLAIEASGLGDPPRGVKYLGSAETLREGIGSKRTGADAQEYDRNLAAMKSAIGSARFELAWSEGATADLDDIVRDASTLVSLVATAGPESLADDVAARRLGLTRRELDVLRRFVAGNTNAEIAETLAISVPTVTTIVGNIYTKLGVDSRAGITATAFKHGLV